MKDTISRIVRIAREILSSRDFYLYLAIIAFCTGFWVFMYYLMRKILEYV